VTQQELTETINKIYNTDLKYRIMTFDEYLKDRTSAHDERLGKIITGIYQGISNGVFDIPSDYEIVCKREHKTLKQMIEKFRNG